MPRRGEGAGMAGPSSFPNPRTARASRGKGEVMKLRPPSFQPELQSWGETEGHGFWLGSTTVCRAKLVRFPYAVLYEIRPGNVRILCVRDHKCHRAYGSDRGKRRPPGA